MGLHCALDIQYKLLGGHGTTARVSQASRIALASLNEWMSVASNLRSIATSTTSITEAATLVLKRLESHLITHAFLIPSPEAAGAGGGGAGGGRAGAGRH